MNQEKVFIKARKKLELFYHGTCDIYEKEIVERENSCIHETIEKQVQTEIPCRITYMTSGAGQEELENIRINQRVRIFFQPEIIVKEGSRICVKQNGMEKSYNCTGSTKRYLTHQEVEAIAEEKWS